MKSPRAREGKLKIEDNLEVMGDNKRNGKWVDEHRGKVNGGGKDHDPG